MVKSKFQPRWVDITTINVIAQSGSNIYDAAKESVWIAMLNDANVVLTFNERELIITPESRIEDVIHAHFKVVGEPDPQRLLKLNDAIVDVINAGQEFLNRNKEYQDGTESIQN